jgi:hypothetical protein
MAEHQLDRTDVHSISQEPTGALVTEVVPVQVDLPQRGTIDAAPGFARLVSWPLADEFSGIEESVRKALRSESPAHPWRASVRRTLKSRRGDQRWSRVAGCPELPRAVSGCVVPPATFIHVPVDRVLHARALRATSAKRAPRWSETERGGWRLIATTECFDVTPVVGACQVARSSLVKAREVLACPRGVRPRLSH